MSTGTDQDPNTTVRHYSLIAEAEKILSQARTAYAIAFNAYLKNPNTETAGAANKADHAFTKAQADYDQAHLLFKQLRLKKVGKDE